MRKEEERWYERGGVSDEKRGHSLIPRPCSGYEAGRDSETKGGGG